MICRVGLAVPQRKGCDGSLPVDASRHTGLQQEFFGRIGAAGGQSLVVFRAGAFVAMTPDENAAGIRADVRAVLIDVSVLYLAGKLLGEHDGAGGSGLDRHTGHVAGDFPAQRRGLAARAGGGRRGSRDLLFPTTGNHRRGQRQHDGRQLSVIFPTTRVTWSRTAAELPPPVVSYRMSYFLPWGAVATALS